MRLNGPMLRIEDPSPLGDVTLAPSAATGRSELETARAMAAARGARARAALQHGPVWLAQAKPRGPLSTRLAALATLMRWQAAPRWSR
jgi:hypothetical protein